MRPARRRSRFTCSAATVSARRCRRSGGFFQHEALSPPSRTNAPKAATSASPPNNPMKRWQLDITHWQLADDTDVEILNIIDDHSRLCLASDTLPVFKARDVNNSFSKAVDAQGNPASLLSDNGAVFTGRYRGTGRVALEVTLHSCGIRFQHCRPYHPQTCGKVERLHQTLKKWLITKARPPLSPTYKPSSTPSAPTTTPCARTAHLAVAPPSRPTSPAPKRPRPALRSTPGLSHPPRPHRQQRQAHRAPQQPPTPHRIGPQTLRHPRPALDPRPTHPGHNHRRPTTTRIATQPDEKLPTTNQTVNDVLRHMCTMSRDIALVDLRDSNP